MRDAVSLSPAAATPSTSSRSRRLDIQGLRAVAVLAVIAFHAHLPVPGGFAGVDVFFVISGFVISGMLSREHARTGRISLRSFWRRRFLRLTPALAATVAVTAVASALLLFPDQQRIAYETGLGALLLMANVVIARNTGGYFDDAAEANPLLNTWSLSVEEQFYLIFPLAVALGWWLSRRWRWRGAAVVLVAGIAAVSAALTFWPAALSSLPMSATWVNFYSPATRAWEFAVGALAFFASTRFSLRRAAPVAGWLGLAAVILSFFVISPETVWPGTWTLLPTLSTALVLVAGTTTGTAGASRLLGARPAVLIGDWSYSLYLWHWPFISIFFVLGATTTMQFSTAAALSVPVALASYYVIEQPIRTRRWQRRGSFGTVVAVTFLVPVVTIGGAALVGNTLERYPGDIGPVYLDYIWANSHACSSATLHDSATRCAQSQVDGSPTVIVMGDSHAEHLYPGLLTAFPDTNVGYVYMEGWPLGDQTAAADVTQAIASDPQVSTVIINGRWTAEMFGGQVVSEAVKRLSDAGKQVFVADDSPYFPFHARQCKYARPFIPERCTMPLTEFTALHDAYLPQLQAMVDGSPNAHLLRTSDGFCDEQTCSMLSDGRLLFSDNGHLNVDGSREVMDRLTRNDARFAERLRAATGSP